MPSFIVTQQAGANEVHHYLTTTPIPETLEVVIKPYKRNRSLEQNALSHEWYSTISRQYHLTHGTLYSPKVWKEYFKQQLLGEETLQGPRGMMVRTCRTRDLSVNQMTDYMERMTIMCADEFNIILMGGDEI